MEWGNFTAAFLMLVRCQETYREVLMRALGKLFGLGEDGRMSRFEELFAGRHFDAEIVVLCVRWYLSFKLSYRDLVSMMSERSIGLAHTTILRWVQHYTPEFEKRWKRYARPVGGSWRMDETYGALSSARFRGVQVPPALE